MRIRNFLLFVFVMLCAEQLSAQLVAQFSADKTSGCAPIRVQFTDASTGGPTEWSWDLGNGTLSPAQNPSTTYFTPGTYTVKLVVKKGAESATIVKTNFITVYAAPTISFSGTPTSGCLPLNVQFNDVSTPGSGTITSWKWDFGDGVLGSGKNPSYTYRSQGKFQVTLTATNSNGCFASSTKANYIVTFDSIMANFGVIAPNVCGVPATFQFRDSSAGANIVFYEWNFGDGSTSNLKSPSHTYTQPGIYDVTLKVRNSSGCEDILVKKGAANAGSFKANFTMPASACLNKPVSFTNTSDPIGLLTSSTWTFGNGQGSSLTNPVTIYNSLGTFAVKLISRFGNCADSTVKTISVVQKPTADFTASSPGTCKPPLNVTFTNSTVGGTVVKWEFGNGQTSTQESPTVTFNTAGTFDIRLIVKNAGGCLDTVVKKSYIKIQDPVIEEINGLPFRGCFPWTNQFGVKVTTGDPVTGWAWDFGDGTTSTQANPVHSYTDTGTYKVKVVITTSQGCTATFTSTVHGGAKPKAMFEGAPNLVCPLDPVFFTDKSTGAIDEWLWHFGDGGSSTDSNPSYKYNDTGWMRVELIVFSNGCADTAALPNYVYVKPPIARFTDSFMCGNQFYHIFQENAIEATYWKWYIDDKDSVEARSLDFTFTDTGTHKIKLYVRGDQCDHEAVKNIVVLDEEAYFVTKDSGDCASTFVTFSVKGPKTHPEYIESYEWFFGDDTSRLLTDTFEVTHEYRMKGIVQVKLIITDINGCSDTLLTDFEVKNFGPVANFGPPYTAICAGNQATFTDSSKSGVASPISSWKWQFGDGSQEEILSAGPVKHIYHDAGFYDVSLLIKDQLGCVDSITRRFAVGVYKPKADFYSPDTIICINAPVEFFNRGSGAGITASWDFGNGQTGNTLDAQTRYATAGLYDVRLVVTDSVNCKDTLFRPRYIRAGDAEADFTMSDSFTTCPPLIVSFTNKSQNNVINEWDFGNGNTSSFLSPYHTYTTSGEFMVKLVVVGNGGCTDSTTKKIAIEGPTGTFTYAPLGGCPPLAVTFVSKAINTRFITWDFSDGYSSVTTDSVTTHLYTLPGTYVPKVIFADTIGCKLPILGPDTIRVVGAKAFIQPIKKANYCDSATISFFDSTITTDVVISYLWIFGDGTTSTARNPVHFYSKPGTYQVIFEVTTLSGCISRDTLSPKIVIAPTPIVTSGPNTPVCVPSTIQFQANWINRDTATLSYNWNFGNGVTSTLFSPPPVLYDKPGNYLVRFIAANRYGCADTSDIRVPVNDTPRVSVAAPAFICRGTPQQLKATGAAQYQWKATPSLSCLNCDNPIANPPSAEVFSVIGIDSNNCKGSKAVEVKVKQLADITVGPGDTLCAGESFKLVASGTERYLWSPAAGLSSTTVASPTATPTVTTNYMVIGYDSLKCFADTGYVSMIVYPIPQFNILESQITANTGSIVTLKTTSSPDITHWHWTPPFGLSCTVCAEPVLTVGKSQVYTARVSNDGGCVAQDQVNVTPICSGDNVYIPNTFSPNGDGQNDEFYPRGRGIALIKAMRIFNRWGELVFEMKDFAPNDRSKGWDGTFKGSKLTPDVYVYMIDVVCDNNTIFNLKGNVTLLK